MGTIIRYIMAYTLLRNMEECVMGYACGVYSWLAWTQVSWNDRYRQAGCKDAHV